MGRAVSEINVVRRGPVNLAVPRLMRNTGATMKKCLLALLLFVFAPYNYADDATTQNPSTVDKDFSETDFEYDGVWKPKGAMLRGTLLPPPALQAITLTIKNGTYEVTVTGEDHSDKGIFMLDETVTPKRMAIQSMSGPNQGKIILAIYEIKGENAMRVCYDLSGDAFPTAFKAPKGSHLYLAGYRRQQTEDSDDKQIRPKPDCTSDAE